MSVEHAIRQRRSIRGLVGPPLAQSEVTDLVALAVTAPAPHHTQPWRFVDVGPAHRGPLADAMGRAWRVDLEADGVPRARQDALLARSHRQLESAPTLLLGCLVAEGLRSYPDERRQRAEWTMATHSFGAAMQNILLAASARGLGAFWISAPLFAQEAVRSALVLEVEWRPQALIALGRPHPEYRPFDRPERDLAAHIVHRA